MTHAKQLATFTTSTVIEFVLGVTFANGSAAVNGQPFAQQPPVAEVFLLDRVPWTNCLMLPSGAETCLEDRACRKKTSDPSIGQCFYSCGGLGGQSATLCDHDECIEYWLPS